MLSCACCTRLGALLLVSLIFVQGLRPPAQRGIQGLARNGRAKVGNPVSPWDRELKANYVDSTDTETLFPVFEYNDAIDSEADFVAYCEEFFLFFEDDPSNAFISQGDLIDFLVDVCSVFDGEDISDFACPRPTFRSISKNVQFTFVKNLCDGNDVALCLESILGNGTEFGYHEDLTKSSFLEELCCDLVQFVSLVGQRKDSDCLQAPISVHIPSSAAPSPIISSQPNGKVLSPTASPVALGPTVNSRPSNESRPSPPVMSNPTTPSQPIVGPGSSPSFTPTISSPQQVPSVTMGPIPTMHAPSPSSPQISQSSNPSSTYDTPFPWNSDEPSNLRIPLLPTRSPLGGDAISNDQASQNNSAIAKNNISVAAILGIVLGFGALLLLGVVSSLKRARKRDFAMMVLSNRTPSDSVQ